MSFTATRRRFLTAAALRPMMVAWPAWMPRLAFTPADRSPSGDTLVVIFLRGAADALNAVVPHGEPNYYRRRPTLAIPRPDDRRAAESARAIDLDGFFGLHPALAPLQPAFAARQLAILHACGAPDESRSHFRAMELMERGVENETGPASGWIGRHLATLDSPNRSPLRAIGLGHSVPLSIRGPVPTTALRSITDFHLGGDRRALQRIQGTLSALYGGDQRIDEVGRETLQVLDTLRRLDPTAYRPATDLAYPESEFGLGLKQVAMLMKAEVGMEIAALDLGGWDTHFAQGGSEGLMANLLSDLARGLAAFHADLSDQMANLSMVVMSEFGRRLQENGSLGTDHGHGGLFMALGGSVAGGRIHGRWPGLEDDLLVGPGDLAVTTDYRDALAELCVRRLNNRQTAEIFPDYEPAAVNLFRT